MNQKNIKLNEEELKAKYPIKGKVAGWYFRIEELSQNC